MQRPRNLVDVTNCASAYVKATIDGICTDFSFANATISDGVAVNWLKLVWANAVISQVVLSDCVGPDVTAYIADNAFGDDVIAAD